MERARFGGSLGRRRGRRRGRGCLRRLGLRRPRRCGRVDEERGDERQRRVQIATRLGVRRDLARPEQLAARIHELEARGPAARSLRREGHSNEQARVVLKDSTPEPFLDLTADVNFSARTLSLTGGPDGIEFLDRADRERHWIWQEAAIVGPEATAAARAAAATWLKEIER